MAGATGMRFSFPKHDLGMSAPSHHEVPLFERMGTDEYAQLQDCRQIIDSLQQRVHDLERINVDLEYRLEDQAKQCMETERECAAVERQWKAKCDQLEKEISNWKEQSEAQKLKGDRLREHLSRTERELYGILQRKYELIRGPGGRQAGSGGGLTSAKQSWDGSNSAMRRSESTSNYGSQDEFLTMQQVRT
jgi:TolA-binding protein